MDPELESALRGLKEAAAFARTYRFEMTEDYLTLLARVEAMPQNQSGADKSHVWPGLQAYRISSRTSVYFPASRDRPVSRRSAALLRPGRCDIFLIGVSGANFYTHPGQAGL